MKKITMPSNITTPLLTLYLQINNLNKQIPTFSHETQVSNTLKNFNILNVLNIKFYCSYAAPQTLATISSTALGTKKKITSMKYKQDIHIPSSLRGLFVFPNRD